VRGSTRRDTAVAVIVFGACIALIGLIHVIFGEKPTRIFPVWPEWLPGRPYWADGAGFALAALGATVMSGRRVREAATGIAAVIFLAVLVLHLPRSLASDTFGDAWLNVLKWSAMAAGARLVAGRGEALARWVLALFMVGSAILHVRYAQFVATLIPEWMPWRVFWTYFAAVALAAGGVGILVPRVRRLAALCSSAMFLGFFLLVHVPRTLAFPRSNVGWLELGESMAYCMIALLIGRSTPRPRDLTG
jgi:uncharacterized membrane protein